jgi:hypothetical protein
MKQAFIVIVAIIAAVWMLANCEGCGSDPATYSGTDAYGENITFELADDGKAVLTWGFNNDTRVEYGTWEEYGLDEDIIIVSTSYGPKFKLNKHGHETLAGYYYIKNGYLYGDVNDATAEHPKRRIKLKEL